MLGGVKTGHGKYPFLYMPNKALTAPSGHGITDIKRPEAESECVTGVVSDLCSQE